MLLWICRRPTCLSHTWFYILIQNSFIEIFSDDSKILSVSQIFAVHRKLMYIHPIETYGFVQITNCLFIYDDIVVFYIHNSYLQFNYSTQESDVKTDLLPYIIRYLLSDNWVCSIISWNYVYSFFIKTTNRLSLMFLECFLLIDLFAQPINLLTFLLKLTYRLL